MIHPAFIPILKKGNPIIVGNDFYTKYLFDSHRHVLFCRLQLKTWTDPV